MTRSAALRRLGPLLLVLVTVATAVSGCVTPARNQTQYRGKASAALQAAGSNVATGLLAVRQDREDKVLPTYADEVVSAAETSMGSVSASFGSVQPPDAASAALRDTVGDALTAAEDALGHARIAVRSGRSAALAASEQELRSAQQALDKLEQEA
jgi:hypothetical protein